MRQDVLVSSGALGKGLPLPGRRPPGTDPALMGRAPGTSPGHLARSREAQPARQPRGPAPEAESRMSPVLPLIEAEIPHLRRFARYVVRDVDRADDLVQECLTRAIAKLHTWTPGTNLRAWLFVILKNCHINEVRRHRPTTEIPNDHPLLNVPANQDAHVNLLEVRDAFLRLSDEHREVLLLVAIEGLQYEEASAILGVPLGTVRSRLSRARQALRDALAEPLAAAIVEPAPRAAS
jgi:RNA polymerase sigma-70 factor, ECF subfamily